MKKLLLAVLSCAMLAPAMAGASMAQDSTARSSFFIATPPWMGTWERQQHSTVCHWLCLPDY